MEKSVQLLQGAQRILLLPHVKPDGDALGSCFALQRALTLLGKEVYIQLEEPELPARYAFLCEDFAKAPAEFAPQLVVALDCGERHMLESRGEEYPDIHLSIDHHRSNTHFGGHNWVEESAAATGELIYDLIGALGVELDREMALCLYVALSSDTGCFKFSNTTEKSFLIGAHLRRVYGSFDKINYRLFTMRTPQEMAVERYIMQTLEFCEEGRIASIVITQEMRRATGAGDDDIGGFAQLPRSIQGVDVGVTFKEDEKGGWRISMRSNELVDVSAVCRRLGGGGHIRASGCQAQGTLEEVKALVLGEAARALHEVLREGEAHER
ncbi:MAG: DHH family phosphoesterase [Eubacteriales bacterium]|jgi:phosphoesterase RecJ-like protein